MLEGNGLLGLRGIHILGNACRKQKLASARIVHQNLYGTQGAVVLTDDVSSWRPSPRIVVHGKAVLVGAIDEALVLPSVAPRIGNNPSAYLILFHLAYNAVLVQVELDSVIVSANSEGMIERVAPLLYILHADNSRFTVRSRSGNSCPCAISRHTDTCHSTTVHGLVATMIVEPFLQLLTAFGRIRRGKLEVVGRLVPHGTVPLVIALHPAIIGVVVRLWSEEPAIGTSAISGDIGDAYRLCHALRRTRLISHQPSEVRRILVLGQRSIGIAITVHLVRELIADASCGTTTAAILIEDGREILVLPVVDIGRHSRTPHRLSCLSASHIIGGLGLGRSVIPEVGEDTAVYLHHLAIRHFILFYLCQSAQRRHNACYQEQTLQFFHVRTNKRGSPQVYAPGKLPLLTD